MKIFYLSPETEKKIIQLYNEENLSSEKVGQKIGCSGTTIRRIHHLFPISRVEDRTDKALLAIIHTFVREIGPVWVPLSIIEKDRNGNPCVPEWWLRKQKHGGEKY